MIGHRMEDKVFFICLIFTINLSVNWASSEWGDPFFIPTNPKVTADGKNINISENVASNDILGYLNYTGNDQVNFFYPEQNQNEIFNKDDQLFIFDKSDKTIRLKKVVDTDSELITPNFKWPTTYFMLVPSLFDCNSDKKCQSSQIIYKDVNDKYPDVKRTPEDNTFDIPENNKETELMIITATDEETYGNNRTMNISIKNEPQNSPFMFRDLGLNKWALVIKENGLDFETMILYQLEIQVTDHPDRFGTVWPWVFAIIVRVLDDGDNPPLWQQSCSMTIIKEENTIGASLFSVKAIDPDTGKDNEIHYTMVNITDSNNAIYEFAQINDAGVVTMKEVIDRESQPYQDLSSPMFFNLAIQPNEKTCDKNCTGPVLECPLSIQDIDDNPPKFDESNNYSITIDENPEPREIFRVGTSDADSFLFDRYSITILDRNDPLLGLGVNPKIANGNSGVNVSISTSSISSTVLDYEKNHQVKFTLELKSVSDDSYTDSHEFTINIMDMNDNYPEFEQTKYIITIKEDLSNLNVDDDGNYDLEMAVSAFDNDETETFGNESLVYGLKNASEAERWLRLDPITGKLTINKKYSNVIDYEVQHSHTIMLEVTDCEKDTTLCSENGGILSNKLPASLSIIIEDVNDEMPILAQIPKIPLCIYENDPSLWPSTLCGATSNFTLSDADSGADLELDIDWSNSTATKNELDLEDDDWKGTLLLKKETHSDGSLVAQLIPNPDKYIDKEKIDQLVLQINARDKNGDPEGDPQYVDLRVTVDVHDVNDNPPSFYPEEVFGVINSGTESGIDVLTIEASDADLVVDGSGLNFTILEIDASNANIGDIEEPFKIDEERLQFQANVRINFSPQSNIKGHFILKMQVKDAANHKQERHFSIIVTTLGNQCNFTFTQDRTLVEHNLVELSNIFSRVFSNTMHENWLFQHTKVESNAHDESSTSVISYFIKNRKEPISRPIVEGAYMNSVIKLSYALSEIGLHLHPSYGMSGVDDSIVESNVNILAIVFIIMSAVFGFFLVGLFITYWIRTANLERKVKALGIEVDDERTPKKPHKLILAGLQENFPGSNEFAEKGANPIWQVAMESTDFEENFKMDDSMSESSGDSILIGVEDQRDFSTLEEVEVDMDLYANLNRKRLQPVEEARDGNQEWSRGRLDDEYPGDDSSEIYTISRPGNPLAGGNPLYNSDEEEDVV